MVEHKQIVNVSEISTIRVTCNSCKSSIEAVLTNVGLTFRSPHCPSCQQEIVIPDEIHSLATAIEKLSNSNCKSTVNFVISKGNSE